MRRTSVALVTVLGFGGLAPTASAVVSVSSSDPDRRITIQGTSAADVVTVAAVTTQADGDRVFRVSNANVTGGTRCTQDGSAAVCNDNASAGGGGVYALFAAMGGQNDTLTNTSQIGGDLDGGPGHDVIRSATASTVASTLRGGTGDDSFAIGASPGADTVHGEDGDDFADYLERATAGVGVDTDGNADDGGPSEGDNVQSTVETVRGTRQFDDLNAVQVDGDLGNDTLAGTTLLLEITARYPRPAGATRDQGLNVDLAAGTTNRRELGQPIEDTLVGAFANVAGSRFTDNLAGTDGVNRIWTNGDERNPSAPEGVSGRGGADRVNDPDAPIRVAGLLQNGGVGAPVIHGGPGDDRLFGNPGDSADLIEGGPGADFIAGLDGDDRLHPDEQPAPSDSPTTGEPPNDVVDGGSGLDTVSYSLETGGVTAALGDAVTPGLGDPPDADLSPASANSQGDQIKRAEHLVGTNFDDVLTGNDDPNTIEGLGGNDTLDDGKRRFGGLYVLARDLDTLNGGPGSDTVDYSRHADGFPDRGSVIDLTGTLPQATDGSFQPEDKLDSVENAIGTPRDDSLIGTGGDNRLDGGDGRDMLDGRFGADQLNGGGGPDTVTYATDTAPVRAALANAPFALANSHGDTIGSDVENLVGGSAADILVGNPEANSIQGGSGDDSIDGGDGDDFLSGNAGQDLIAPLVNRGTALAPSVAPDRAPVDDGRDTTNGGLGNDRVDTRDGREDNQAFCDSGTDTAVLDLRDPRSNANCETEQRAQVDVHPLARLTRIRRGRRSFAATLVCPRVKTRQIGRFCRGTLTLRARSGKRTYGRRRYAVRQGRSRRVRMRLRRGLPRRAVAQLVEVQRNKRRRTTTHRLR